MTLTPNVKSRLITHLGIYYIYIHTYIINTAVHTYIHTLIYRPYIPIYVDHNVSYSYIRQFHPTSVTSMVVTNIPTQFCGKWKHQHGCRKCCLKLETPQMGPEGSMLSLLTAVECWRTLSRVSATVVCDSYMIWWVKSQIFCYFPRAHCTSAM